MTTTPPPQVRAFEARMAQLQLEREQAFAAMGAATGTATSDNGAVTVTSTAQGVLTDLRLSAADPEPGPELAALLLDTTRRAQKQALTNAASGVGAIVGADNPAVAVLQRQSDEIEVLEPGSPARRDIGGDIGGEY